jgi:hypothetical protein
VDDETLQQDIENRVRKLPKPATESQGLLPVFEAISNGVHAVEDRRETVPGFAGGITIDVENLDATDSTRIVVSDDGVGLDDHRFKAFKTLDTDFKKKRGGKGVGRLFWLDAFHNITVHSTYESGDDLDTRAFEFKLANARQIVPLDLPFRSRGTTISFLGLRGDYAAHFPKDEDGFKRLISAHFISDFLLGRGPAVTLSVDGSPTKYPAAVKDLVVGNAIEEPLQLEKFGDFKLTAFTCLREASAGLDGSHNIHFLGHGRTVETRKVDNLLGLGALSDDGHDDLVLHLCVQGEYLDSRVNEGRTAFTFPENVLKELIRECMEVVKDRMFPDQVAKYEEMRRGKYAQFVSHYPIYGFDDTDIQLRRVPFHATAAEDFAAGLVKHQIRREESRRKEVQAVIESLGSANFSVDLGAAVIEAAEGIQASEQLALAHHVVRRKLVLELLEKLLLRLRERDGKPDDNQLEKTLHTIICPMRIRGDDPQELRSRAHDLWVVDERFAFTRAFSSDKRLDKILKDGGGADRPDLLLWDLAFGMSATAKVGGDKADLSEPLRKMLVVEFKKPGRRDYADAKDQIEQQVVRYLAQLKGGEMESYERQRIRIAPDCVFHCFVVADIVGDLEQQLSGWKTTANGQGRIRLLEGDYRGSIEVVQWTDLVNDAWHRNMSTIAAAGLGRS